MSRDFAGSRVLPSVLLLLALTVVIPPAAATALANWRIARASAVIGATAASLAGRDHEFRDLARRLDVLCGPGRLPDATGEAHEWLAKPLGTTGTLATAWPRDPWGSCLLLDLRGVAAEGSGLLISAGPNGSLETRLGAAAPQGDDIATVVR